MSNALHLNMASLSNDLVLEGGIHLGKMRIPARLCAVLHIHSYTFTADTHSQVLLCSIPGKANQWRAMG